jgi:N,N'-diacetylchitobiose phosphorylase
MRYGHFDDANREYVIDRPDTPRPWMNYLGDRAFGGIITNHAGGFAFLRSPAEGRLTRFRYNSVPVDQPGRYLYLRDADTGDFWSASWQPVGKPLDRYRSTCRFGMGYAVLGSEYDGIATESTYFVPLGQLFEYWVLKVTNTGPRPRRLSAFAYAEFVTEWNLVNDLLNLQYAQYITEATYRDGVIGVSQSSRLPPDPSNFANRDQSRWWWMSFTPPADAAIASHDLDRDAFVGAYGSLAAPRAVVAGRCSDSIGYADNLCGAFSTDFELAPGETREIVVLLGSGKAEVEGAAARREFANVRRAGEELARLKEYQHARLECLQVKTPDPDFDHMINVWNHYNALMTFTWSRACSLVYTGDQRDGLGFRDSVQDTLGATLSDAPAVRERLLLMLSAQESTGGARPEVKPWLHKPGHMPPTPPEHYRSDDCLWFFNSIPAYVNESGDTDFYRTAVPYSDTGSATVFQHLRRALEFNLERTGRNGLPCGLLADWNDCLKLGYRGESVFVAFQVRLGLSVYADVARQLGHESEAHWAIRQLADLDARIQKVCWDGQWFIWAIAEDGTVFGTKDYPEGQVYLNTQVWAVISGAASPEQASSALHSVRTRLASEYGVAMCDPPFRNTPVAVMRAVLFNPGCKENGGIFSHTQSWAVLAEILAGDPDTAYAYYRAFMPSAYNDRAELREIEPYVHCQSTHARTSPKFGKSRVSWLSGTASWAFHTAHHDILGLQPTPDGLRIAPCLPRSWDKVTLTRTLRGNKLHITLLGGGNRVASVSVNGKPHPGNHIPNALLAPNTTIEVRLS